MERAPYTSLIFSDATARSVERLRSELPQGIILTGPEGIGLGTAARAIAHFHTNEVIVISPDEKGTIGIDRIRELYTLGRAKGKLTIFIIDDADGMGIEAQNALLKLLEEPIASLRFILTSHAPARLLPTVRSRVAEYVLTPLSGEQTDMLLDTLSVRDPTTRLQLAFIAGGLPALLTRYAKDTKAFADRSSIVRDAREFLQGSREARLLLVSRYKDRQQALNLIDDVLKLLRRAIAGNPQSGGSDSFDAVLEAQAALIENASVRLTLTALALAL